MEYGKIIAVTGLTGLYELLTSKSDGGIIRSLEDKSTKFVSSRVHNFSHLESIEVFTQKDNINLVEIFQEMEKSSDKLPDTKDGAALKKYFEKVYSDLDFERVYTSDLKKMVKWYEILKNNKVELKLSAVEEDVEETEDAETPEVKTEEDSKPAKKAAPKAKKDDKTEEAEEEKPKKAAAKAKPAAKAKETGKDTKDKKDEKSAPAKTAKKAATPKKSSE